MCRYSTFRADYSLYHACCRNDVFSHVPCRDSAFFHELYKISVFIHARCSNSVFLHARAAAILYSYKRTAAILRRWSCTVLSPIMVRGLNRRLCPCIRLWVLYSYICALPQLILYLEFARDCRFGDHACSRAKISNAEIMAGGVHQQVCSCKINYSK